jgi:hypothetical protein
MTHINEILNGGIRKKKRKNRKLMKKSTYIPSIFDDYELKFTYN